MDGSRIQLDAVGRVDTICLVSHNGWAGPAGRRGASAARGVLRIGRAGGEGSCGLWPSPAPFRTSAVPAARSRAGRSLPSKHSARDAAGGSRRTPTAWPDRRTGTIGTRQREPGTKVPRQCTARRPESHDRPCAPSNGGVRNRTPAACEIARPEWLALRRDMPGTDPAATPGCHHGPARPSRGRTLASRRIKLRPTRPNSGGAPSGRDATEDVLGAGVRHGQFRAAGAPVARRRSGRYPA